MDVNAKLLGYVTGLKNSSVNPIEVFKTNVMRNQPNGQGNTKIKYCRWLAGRKLTKGSIVYLVTSTHMGVFAYRTK